MDHEVKRKTIPIAKDATVLDGYNEMNNLEVVYDAKAETAFAAAQAADSAWDVAKTACLATQDVFSNAKVDLKVKLKDAYAAYRVAEVAWIKLGGHDSDIKRCQARANSLQKVIDALYTDAKRNVDA